MFVKMKRNMTTGEYLSNIKIDGYEKYKIVKEAFEGKGKRGKFQGVIWHGFEWINNEYRHRAFELTMNKIVKQFQKNENKKYGDK